MKVAIGRINHIEVQFRMIRKLVFKNYRCFENSEIDFRNISVIVGNNNAGKSTLLSTVSAARPKIADYPFTTLEPNLGIVSYYDDKSFVMADIPGIIEGAHEGKGIGMRFLRHIERNSILLFMVAADQDDIKEGYEVLLNELKEYNPELLVKDRVLAITKSDMLDEQLKSEIAEQLPTDLPHVFISSFTQEGIKELKDMLWNSLHKEVEAEDAPVVLFPGDDNEITLE